MLIYDDSKPDGTPRKLLNVNRINQLGGKATTSLRDGLEKTVRECELNNIFMKKSP